VSSAQIIGDSPVSAELDMILDFLDVEDENPLSAAQILVSDGFDAGPIYATGQAGHWSMKPGTDPIPITGASLPAPTATLGGAVVAVVDSGLAEPMPQSWMSGDGDGSADQGEQVWYDQAFDTEQITEPDLASHGTFVTSVIRQIAPEHVVAFARARPVPTEQILGNNHPLPPNLGYVSTELHVAEGILRLIENDDLNSENVVALNLSLGAYTCTPDDDPTLITTRTALASWYAAFPFSTVFAAGGNEIPSGVFWPAGFSYYPFDPNLADLMRGVGAIRTDGVEVVWTPPAPGAAGAPIPKAAPTRSWVNNVAPGCDILGLRGGSETEVVAWSGSSFASAVSAAAYADAVTPGAPQIPDDQDYSVPGLISDSQGTCDF
jgi:hypothetical protein